jgi:quercetin dioxygenase-like cupin family protein
MKKTSLKKRLQIVSVIAVAACIWSCNNSKDQQSGIADKTGTDGIFPKGEKVTNDNFKGTVWLNYLAQSDTIHNVNIGSVTFEPGARTNWHYHKGGQILMITEGKGLYQEKGRPVEVIEKGEVIKCPPNVEHWHGATPEDTMTHIAIGTNTNVGGAVWLKPVSDQEYTAAD